MILVAPDHIESTTGRLLDKQTAAEQRAISGKHAFGEGDIVYSKIRPYLRKAILAEFGGLCSADMYPLKPASDVSAGFMLAVLLGHRFSKYAESVSVRSGMPKINRAELAEYGLALPSLPEQRAIAEALSDVDALLAKLDALIAKKRDLKQAAMQQLLTGQTRLPGFSGEWETVNLSEKFILKARIGWQGLTTAEYLKTGDYYLVTGTDFANGHIDWSSCYFVAPERYVQDRNIQLRRKDILLTKDGTIGKVGFIDDLPGEATLNSGVFVIRPKDDAYDQHFIYYILTSRIFDDFLVKLQAGSTISHLYQKDFVTFSFFAPAMSAEQNAIAEILSNMDAELLALEKRRDKTQALKQGMMQELLTGRIRLV